jgi:hypothetical protein
MFTLKKGRGGSIHFFNETSACGTDAHILMLTSIYQHVKKATVYYMCIVYLHLRTRVAQ